MMKDSNTQMMDEKAQKRSLAAHKAVATKKAKALFLKRSTAAKKAWATRKGQCDHYSARS